jgi:hypothetical protein
MRLKQAPQEVIAAIASFLDDCVAKKTLDILKRYDYKNKKPDNIAINRIDVRRPHMAPVGLQERGI